MDELSPARSRDFEMARKTGYLLTSSKGHPAVKNAWFQYCDDNHIPFVWALRRGSKSIVEADIAGYRKFNYRIGEAGRQEALALSAHFGLHEKNCQVDGEIVRFEEVPDEIVREACRALVEMIEAHKELRA